MADKQKEIKENYERNLKAMEYNKTLTGSLQESTTFFDFAFTFLHDVIHSGRFKGTKVLEIGSGATVYGIASASLIYPNIVQSDFVGDNTEELKKWLKGESALDWSDFLKIVARIEGYDDIDKGVKLLETQIRKNVKAVVRSDVLSEPVIPLEELKTEEIKPPYDLIISCLCLETAPADYDGYVNALKRVNKLLRPGGGLITCGLENGANWKIEENEFHYIKLTMDDIINALNTAGFGQHHFKQIPKLENVKYDYEYGGIFAVASEKL